MGRSVCHTLQRGRPHKVVFTDKGPAGRSSCGGRLREQGMAMRFDGQDPIDSGPSSPPESAPAELPLDAAESTWDPWLWALYLRELASERPAVLH